MLDKKNEHKKIEEYILNDFLPNYFSGFKEIDSKFSKNGHHKTFFKYQEKKYVIEVLTFGNGYAGYLNILHQIGSEMVFSNKGNLEEFFLIANKSMKQYKLSKLYK